METESIAQEHSEKIPNRRKGVSRFQFLIGFIVLTALNIGILVLSGGNVALDSAMGVLYNLVPFALAIALMVMRLWNIGVSGWLVLFLFVPIVGLLFLIACFMLPPNYKEDRVLDLPAKIILGIVGISVALILLSYLI